MLLRGCESSASPETHDVNTVCQLENVRHIVTDEDHRKPPVPNRPDEVQHFSGLADSESGGRLIHDDQAASENGRTSHRYPLPLAAREIFNRAVDRRKMELQLLHFFLRLSLHSAFIQQPKPGTKQPAAANFSTQKEVGRDIEGRSDGEILVYSLDAALARVEGALEVNRHPVQQDFPLIWYHRAAKHFDQRALARAVVTNDREHLACSQLQMACKGRGRVFGRLTRSMKKYTVCHSVTAAPAAAKSKVKESGSLLKIGVDIHRENLVVVTQYDHATPRPPQRFAPAKFVPWVQARVQEGLEVHVVYEACGFGYGLYRGLLQAGAYCYVVAPQKLDEANTRVKTDGRDSRALCLRLDRYLAGNKNSLAVIRVPDEEEERARHWVRQREQLVHHRQKLEAQGRGLLVDHGLPAPARWWRPQSWKRLGTLLPLWILSHLELYRPVLLALDQQIRALTVELERAAPAALPKGIGALSTVIISREICNWQRFNNRRQVSSYTGLCPGEYSSGSKRVSRSITRHGNSRLRAALVELAWRLVRYQPGYHPVQKRLTVLAQGAQATRAQRKKAIVAVARQVAVDLWRLHTARCTPAMLGFK